jgi:hypothetical protein
LVGFLWFNGLCCLWNVFWPYNSRWDISLSKYSLVGIGFVMIFECLSVHACFFTTFNLFFLFDDLNYSLISLFRNVFVCFNEVYDIVNQLHFGCLAEFSGVFFKL